MKLNLLILAILVICQHPVLADIVTDGSVGPAAQSINAIDGQLTIGQELGSLKGKNLFHSFQQFDIERNEMATFTGNDAIENVISRVTGGNESHINGILRSEVGSADFYFINPAGVVFEENSKVDVPASFHISSAGELIFADGSSFSALIPEASTLTVATPEAFGFTSEQNGSLKIIGGKLKFKLGTDVSLSANGLDIQQNASITADVDVRPVEQPGLHLNLAAIDSSKPLKIPIIDLTNTQATGGELLIENSNIDVSGNGAGRLAIRAGTMTVTGSKSETVSNLFVDTTIKGLFANNLGTDNAHGEDGISVDVNSLDLQDAFISSKPIDDGDGGKIELKAKQLKISGTGQILQGTGANGNTGNIMITVSGAMQINEGKIGSATTGPGEAGIVDVTARQLIINGPRSEISSDTFSEGNAGNIRVKATELMKIQNGGKITAAVRSEKGGDAGNIEIIAPILILDAGQILNDTESKSQGGEITIDEQTQIVGIFDTEKKPNSINVIYAASGLVSVGPERNLAADLGGVIAPNLNIEGINQDPCAHGDENSLKSLGHGGAPAFQHGENYLPINRFNGSEREFDDRDVLKTTSPVNAVIQNTATECARSQRTSLN